MAQAINPVCGMTYASCVNRIERKVKKLEGVENLNVNLATEKRLASQGTSLQLCARGIIKAALDGPAGWFNN